MLRLQLYILRRLATSLLLVVLVVSTILFIAQTVRFLDRMPDVGLGFIVAVLPMFLPVTLAFTLPFAFLVAAVITYGRLADDNEVIAMRMAGIHPWAIAAPGVFAGAVLSFFCLDLQGNLAPAAVAGQDSLRFDVHGRFLEVIERAERNSFTASNFKISWAGVEEGELSGLHISRAGAAPGEFMEVHADRGALQKDPTGAVLVFHLEDYVWIQGEEGRRPWSTRGSGLSFSIPAEELLGIQGGATKPRALGNEALLFRLFRVAPGTPLHGEFQREILGRIAIALGPLCFALCGIPLALLVGRGSRAAAAVLAFAVALVFFVLLQAGSSAAASGALPAVPAMFGANAVLAAAGAGLFALVVRR